MGVNALNIDHLKKIVNTEIKVAASQRRLARIKLYILEKDGFACRSCGATENLSIDHLVPVREIKQLSHSGAQKLSWGHYKDQCQVLCVSCHDMKNVVETLVWIETLTEKEKLKWYKRFERKIAKKAGHTWPQHIPIPEWLTDKVKNGKLQIQKEGEVER